MLRRWILWPIWCVCELRVQVCVCVFNSKLPVDTVWKRLVMITCRQKADHRLQAIQLLLKLLDVCTTSRFVTFTIKISKHFTFTQHQWSRDLHQPWRTYIKHSRQRQRKAVTGGLVSWDPSLCHWGPGVVGPVTVTRGLVSWGPSLCHWGPGLVGPVTVSLGPGLVGPVTVTRGLVS